MPLNVYFDALGVVNELPWGYLAHELTTHLHSSTSDKKKQNKTKQNKTKQNKITKKQKREWHVLKQVISTPK